MINVNIIRNCSYLNSLQVEALLKKKYPKIVIMQCEFIGIDNEKFCYNVSEPDTSTKTGLRPFKVFVYMNDNGEVVADC